MQSFEKFIRENNYTQVMSDWLNTQIQGLKNQATQLDMQLVQTGTESVEQRAACEANSQNLKGIDKKDVIAMDHASQRLT